MARRKDENKGVREAIDRAGSAAALARTLGVSAQVVFTWLNRRCPSNRAVELEEVFGVPRETIRPDLYEGFVRHSAPDSGGLGEVSFDLDFKPDPRTDLQAGIAGVLDNSVGHARKHVTFERADNGEYIYRGRDGRTIVLSYPDSGDVGHAQSQSGGQPSDELPGGDTD